MRQPLQHRLQWRAYGRPRNCFFVLLLVCTLCAYRLYVLHPDLRENPKKDASGVFNRPDATNEKRSQEQPTQCTEVYRSIYIYMSACMRFKDTLGWAVACVATYHKVATCSFGKIIRFLPATASSSLSLWLLSIRSISARVLPGSSGFPDAMALCILSSNMVCFKKLTKSLRTAASSSREPSDPLELAPTEGLSSTRGFLGTGSSDMTRFAAQKPNGDTDLKPEWLRLNNDMLPHKNQNRTEQQCRHDWCCNSRRPLW